LDFEQYNFYHRLVSRLLLPVASVAWGCKPGEFAGEILCGRKKQQFGRRVVW